MCTVHWWCAFRVIFVFMYWRFFFSFFCTWVGLLYVKTVFCFVRGYVYVSSSCQSDLMYIYNSFIVTRAASSMKHITTVPVING